MSIVERAAPDITSTVVADALVLLSAGDSEADAVTYAVSVAGRGWINGEELATALRQARPEVERLSPRHHRDYTGHILRQAPHVCRHVRGEPLYWAHEAPECSATCQQPQNHRRHTAPVWGTCQTCGLVLPASGRCDLCQ
jgi:hypothetical protein